MELEIVDLEEFTNDKAIYAQLGDYKINTNDIPLKVALKLNDYYKKVKTNSEVDHYGVIKDIVLPIITRQYPNATLEEIEEKFNYDQLAKVLNMIFTSFLMAGGDTKAKDDAKNNDDKKKE